MKPNSDTPETDQQEETVENLYNDLVCSKSAVRLVVPADLARKLERERDEARKEVQLQNNYKHTAISRAESAEAERDQLRKVADEQNRRLTMHHESWGECSGCPDCDVSFSYNNLPHVKK